MLAHELTHVVQQDRASDLTRTTVGTVGGCTRLGPVGIAGATSRQAGGWTVSRGCIVGSYGLRISNLAPRHWCTDSTHAADALRTQTELSGLSVGNFDFHFSDCGILVWVWVKFKFTSDITAADRRRVQKTVDAPCWDEFSAPASAP